MNFANTPNNKVSFLLTTFNESKNIDWRVATIAGILTVILYIYVGYFSYICCIYFVYMFVYLMASASAAGPLASGLEGS